MAGAEPAIVAEELVKTYRGGVRALDGLSFTAEPGAVFALLGPNGAGKSTTVKSLTTLSVPDSGRARVAGIDVLREPGRVRRAIGVVAQKNAVDVEATGRENLALQASVFGLHGAAPRARVQELLETFALGEAADRLARNLLGRHAAQARHRDGPRAPAGGAVPRRADDGARPGGARRPLDGDRAPHGRGPHDPPDDALPRRGRPARAARRDRRPRPRRRGRHARCPEGRAARRRHPRRAADAAGEAVAAALAAVPGLVELRLDGTRIDARAESAAAALPAVLAAIEGAGAPVRTATIARPSLDDVYLHHVGRRFDETGEAAR